MRPLCIAFDLDDTLYLERDYVWSGFCALGQWVKTTLGVRDFHLKAWTLFEQGVRGRIFDEALLAAGIRPEQSTIRTMVDLYRRHMPDIQLQPDAARCLESIHDVVHLALVSDGPEHSQRNKIKALGLEQSFEKVVLTSMLGSAYAKPHVKAFLAIEKNFGKLVQQYVYVADNPTKDFLGPRNLGWKTIRVRRSQGLYHSLEAGQGEDADAEMPGLSSLTAAICGENRKSSL